MFAYWFPNGLTQYLTGGLLIGLGVALLYLTTGRPGGISSAYSSVWSWCIQRPFFQSSTILSQRRWRILYALGLVLGGTLYWISGLPILSSDIPAWKLMVGGVLIGFGTRLGGGCTSGHGICGMASLSPGSIAMVGIFLSTAIATAWMVRGLGL